MYAHKQRIVECLACLLHHMPFNVLSLEILQSIHQLCESLLPVDENLHQKAVVYLLFDISLWQKSRCFAVQYQLLYFILPSLLPRARGWIVGASIPFGMYSLSAEHIISTIATRNGNASVGDSLGFEAAESRALLEAQVMLLILQASSFPDALADVQWQAVIIAISEVWMDWTGTTSIRLQN